MRTITGLYIGAVLGLIGGFSIGYIFGHGAKLDLDEIIDEFLSKAWRIAFILMALAASVFLIRFTQWMILD